MWPRFFNMFPFTTFDQVNLDWMLTQFGKVMDRINGVDSSLSKAEELLEEVNGAAESCRNSAEDAEAFKNAAGENANRAVQYAELAGQSEQLAGQSAQAASESALAASSAASQAATQAATQAAQQAAPAAADAIRQEVANDAASAANSASSAAQSAQQAASYFSGIEKLSYVAGPFIASGYNSNKFYAYPPSITGKKIIAFFFEAMLPESDSTTVLTDYFNSINIQEFYNDPNADRFVIRVGNSDANDKRIRLRYACLYVPETT